jgi:hypothetical protein
MPHAISSRIILAINEWGISICGSASIEIAEIRRIGDGTSSTTPQAGHGKDRPRYDSSTASFCWQVGLLQLNLISTGLLNQRPSGLSG